MIPTKKKDSVTRNKTAVNKHKYVGSELFNFAANSYLERTSRPIYALVFLLPFIVFYELGTILINTDVLNQTQDRVVAFIWLQSFINEYLGLGSKFAWIAPPLTVVVVLIALQLVSHKKWHFNINDIGVMTLECTMLAIPLIVLSLVLSRPAKPTNDFSRCNHGTIQVQTEGLPICSSVTKNHSTPAVSKPVDGYIKNQSLLANIVTGIGAGIYEELIFRLILICILMMLFQDVIRLERRSSIILSVLISAALFSAHHHIVFINGKIAPAAPFSWTEFSFRTIAGVYFAILFAIRGFGITAGSHIFYDIIATIINTIFFHR